MMKTKSVYFSAFRGGNIIPANFETWMEDMAIQGWKVEKIGQWSSLKMDFIEIAPKKYRFVYDMNSFPNEEYKSIYEQFGWEYVGQMASAVIWRKEYTDQRPESFSDLESVEKRNKRVINAVKINFVLFLTAAISFLGTAALKPASLSLSDIVQFIIMGLFMLLITIYLGSVIYAIRKNMDR
ncbi:MAG: DUF2812 domain-containing protein [Anaerolineaceae bacterium]|nr:DUF2812 domain-containing protein [Anaerolineaceae bacterium]